jgi:hypothetical protein
MRRPTLLLLLLGACITYTVKVEFSPLPVVLSWGGYTPDGKLIGDGGMLDAGGLWHEILEHL